MHDVHVDVDDESMTSMLSICSGQVRCRSILNIRRGFSTNTSLVVVPIPIQAWCSVSFSSLSTSTIMSRTIEDNYLSSDDTDELLAAITGSGFTHMRSMVHPSVPPASSVQFSPRTAFTNRTATAQPPQAQPPQPTSLIGAIFKKY